MMNEHFMRYIKSTHPKTLSAAFEAGWECAPHGFWMGFALGSFNAAILTGVLWWLS